MSFQFSFTTPLGSADVSPCQLIKLTDEDMSVLNQLHKKPGMHRSLLRYHSYADDGTVLGWTYEQLGWNMVKGGIIAT